MDQFKSAVETFARLVTRDPSVESAWLSALSHIEDLASQQIRRNISDATPADAVVEITAHADDELRHCAAFRQMMPMDPSTDPRTAALEARLKRIISHFVMGYFGNPMLATSSSKHVAYIHGAQTIEQFPFQVYSAYLRVTGIEKVKQMLPLVLKDEFGHLELGRRLMEDLPEDDRLPLERLQEIEIEMCHRMILRMTSVVREHLGVDAARGEAVEESWDELVEHVASDDAFTVAWARAFSHGEKIAANYMGMIFDQRGLPRPEMMAGHFEDEMRHSALIAQAVEHQRRKLVRDPKYVELEAAMIRATDMYVARLLTWVNRLGEDPHLYYLIGALCLETRVFRHYKEIIASNDHIGLTHLLSRILKEEAAHTSMTYEALRNLGIPQESYRQARNTEERLFERLSREWTRAMEAYRAPVELVQSTQEMAVSA